MKVAGLARRIDPVIHERVRLGILSALAGGGPQAFADLRRVLEATDGNLYVHLRVLAEAGYVQEHRTGAGRRQRAFRKYLDLLEVIVAQAGGKR